MLKGQVFARQLFENQIFALFINTFLNGKNGIINNYMNGMSVTYAGTNVTVNSGAICIQGRFLTEDTSTTITAGTNSAYCKLVVEIDLDQINTESDFNQGSYKIISSTTGYPALTQSDIVNNNAGVYQYELARFQTSSNEISNFQDMRSFLDFDSIYAEIQRYIDSIEDQSGLVTRNDIAYINNSIIIPANSYNIETINYPSNFNKNNSVEISFGLARAGDSTGKGFNFVGNFEDSGDLLANAYKRRVNLTDEGIRIAVQNPTASELNLDYKLVLLRIT